MADWDSLVEAFKFDLWANLRWLECLNRKELGDPDRTIFGHILSAQKIWVMRINGESPNHMPAVELSEESLAEINALWVDALSGRQDDPIIHYRRTTGEANSLRLSEIARHAANHGTYHRGELRGICFARGDDDFPETDLALYFMATDPTR